MKICFISISYSRGYSLSGYLQILRTHINNFEYLLKYKKFKNELNKKKIKYFKFIYLTIAIVQ